MSTSTPSPAAPPPTGAPAAVNAGDRLSFTLFLALAVHALLIFGVSFTLPKAGSSPPTLEITLANHRANQAPEQADFLAQHNQEASGTELDARQLTTEQHAEFADTQVRDLNPAPQVQAATPNQQQQQQLLTTTRPSTRVLPRDMDPEPLYEQQQREGQLQDQPMISAEIASLQAKLDQQRQEYAKRPRIHRLTSVATRESVDARYLHDWSSKIELIGNRNYPQEALNRRITGSLSLMVAINPNGTIHRVEVLQSSGHRVLDDAALQIVRLAAPYEAFPAEISQNYDRLEIIRTWHFEITGLTTAN